MRTAKVHGHDNLRKDLYSQGVINDDETAFETAVRLKNARLQEISKNQELENRIKTLESLVNRLLEGKE